MSLFFFFTFNTCVCVGIMGTYMCVVYICHAIRVRLEDRLQESFLLLQCVGSRD